MDDSKEYTISLYGRFGYFVMCFPTALCALMFLPVLRDIVNGIHNNNIGVQIFFIAIGIGSLGLLCYNICNIVKCSPRVITTSNVLIYNGILGGKEFQWSEITKMSLNFSGRSPYVLLCVGTRKSKYGCKLDVSGMNPNYKELIHDMKVRMHNIGKGVVVDGLFES